MKLVCIVMFNKVKIGRAGERRLYYRFGGVVPLSLRFSFSICFDVWGKFFFCNVQ